ncbi:MAG TPA: hypothetical protein VGB73_09440 [Pyrinomonadaceae bacterium]|jgi:hypothetical protein
MGEMRERVWGVISERGCEAAGVDYAEAARLVRELREARISGLCIVTDVVARQLASAQTRGDEPSQTKATPIAR